MMPGRQQTTVVCDCLCGDTDRLQSFRSLFNAERYFLSFFEGFESGSCNRPEMNENIFTAIFLGYKPETFGFIKPLYRTCCHITLPKKLKTNHAYR